MNSAGADWLPLLTTKLCGEVMVPELDTWPVGRPFGMLTTRFTGFSLAGVPRKE
jgi:hypothetical protein